LPGVLACAALLRGLAEATFFFVIRDGMFRKVSDGLPEQGWRSMLLGSVSGVFSKLCAAPFPAGQNHAALWIASYAFNWGRILFG
jgi:hypothetical protein